MPQIAGSGSGDRKIACETLADGGTEEDSHGFVIVEAGGNIPPESFWLSKDAEYDWFDRNAFYDRKDSEKGNANSTSNHNSQRFSVNLKSKASMIGLPKTQRSNFVDAHRRTCRSAKIRLFPKRSASAVAEPGSPKVSCMGKVRSKHGRRRSNSVKRGKKQVGIAPQKLPETKNAGDKKKAGGIYSKFMSMFRLKKKVDRSSSGKAVELQERVPAAVKPRRKSTNAAVKASSEPPSLGGMKKFASGRQSGSWTAEDFNLVVAEMPGAVSRR